MKKWSVNASKSKNVNVSRWNAKNDVAKKTTNVNASRSKRERAKSKTGKGEKNSVYCKKRLLRRLTKLKDTRRNKKSCRGKESRHSCSLLMTSLLQMRILWSMMVSSFSRQRIFWSRYQTKRKFSYSHPTIYLITRLKWSKGITAIVFCQIDKMMMTTLPMMVKTRKT